MHYESLPDLPVRNFDIADNRLTERPNLVMSRRGSLRKIVESVVSADLRRSARMSIRQLTPWVWLLDDQGYPLGIFVSDAADFLSVRDALREEGIAADFFEPLLTSGLAV